MLQCKYTVDTKQVLNHKQGKIEKALCFPPSSSQTWNWSKQVSGGSPPTPRLGGLPLHYKTRISDQGPRSMGLGMLYPILLVLLFDINRNSKMQESTTGHQNWSDNRESKFSTAGNITMRVHIDTPSPASFCQFCSAKLILMSTSQSRKGKARGQPRPLYNRMSQRVAVDALEDNTHQNLYDPYLEITLFPSWVLHNHGAERLRTWNPSGDCGHSRFNYLQLLGEARLDLLRGPRGFWTKCLRITLNLAAFHAAHFCLVTFIFHCAFRTM